MSLVELLLLDSLLVVASKSLKPLLEGSLLSLLLDEEDEMVVDKEVVPELDESDKDKKR